MSGNMRRNGLQSTVLFLKEKTIQAILSYFSTYSSICYISCWIKHPDPTQNRFDCSKELLTV